MDTLHSLLSWGKKKSTDPLNKQRPYSHVPGLQGELIYPHALPTVCILTHVQGRQLYSLVPVLCAGELVMVFLSWPWPSWLTLCAPTCWICLPHLTFACSVTRSTTVFDLVLLSLAMGKASSGTTKSFQIRRRAFISCTTEIQL